MRSWELKGKNFSQNSMVTLIHFPAATFLKENPDELLATQTPCKQQYNFVTIAKAHEKGQ